MLEIFTAAYSGIPEHIERLTTERDEARKEVTALRDALRKKDACIALLSSMVQGRESHSPVSRQAVVEALLTPAPSENPEMWHVLIPRPLSESTTRKEKNGE